MRVVDDYGHHPAEIRATLAAAREVHAGRIVVVFQPHRYTRTRDLWDEFVRAFNDADVLVLTEIYAAGEDKIPGVEAAPLAEAMRAHGHRDVRFVPDLERALEHACQALAAPGDLVVTLGAGSISTLGGRAARAPGGARLVISRAARAELEEALGDRVRFDVPLARYTSLRVGGPADALATPADRAELARLLALCARHRLPHLVLGAGFNTLALDAGVEGVVIQLGRLRAPRGAAGRDAARRGRRLAQPARQVLHPPRLLGPRVRRRDPGNDRRLGRDERGHPVARGAARGARDRGDERRPAARSAISSDARCASSTAGCAGWRPARVILSALLRRELRDARRS